MVLDSVEGIIHFYCLRSTQNLVTLGPTIVIVDNNLDSLNTKFTKLYPDSILVWFYRSTQCVYLLLI